MSLSFDSLCVGSMKLDRDSLNLMTKDPKSSSELKEMKAELDKISLILNEGKATAMDKENAAALGRTLKQCLSVRSVAEKAAKTEIDTGKLKQDLEELNHLMEGVKNGTATPGDLKRASSLKEGVKDSLQIKDMRAGLEKRTCAKKRVSILLEQNLEEARRGRNIAICFLVDCTGSMQSLIDGVKTQIKNVVNEYKKVYPDSVLNFAFVGYRDFDRDEFPVQPFTPDLSVFRSCLDDVDAGGGDDTCEDVIGGLDHTLNLDWEIAGKGSSRILVHIADAPGHGKEYNGGCNDKYADDPTPNGKSKDATHYLQALRALNVHYFFYRVNSTCDAMVAKFNEQVKKNGKSRSSDYITIQELSQVEDLTQSVLKTLSSSVLKTYMAARSVAYSKLSSHMTSISEADEGSVSGVTSLGEPDDVKEIQASSISWNSVLDRQVEVLVCKPPLGISSLQHKTSPIYLSATSAGPAALKWYAEAPFAKGACRWAYWGRLQVRGDWRDVVLKRFIGDNCHSKARYLKTLEESAIAKFLADNYNARRSAGCKAVRFLAAGVIEMMTGGRTEFFSCEEALPPGSFVKFCSNAGDWSQMDLDRSLLEFAKYTYDATGGYIMVTDLQGVASGSEFVLTDPALVCRDVDRFTETNVGEKGIKINYEMVKKLLG